jgi:hypothetical protein
MRDDDTYDNYNLIHIFISSLKMYTVSYIIIPGSNSYARLIAVMWF